jgi:large subunit ribosomal protein L24
MLSRVRKNDTVVVLAGKDKGKQGLVISVDHVKGMVVVKDVAIVTRHVKARKTGEKSGLIKEEAAIPLCKVMPICPICKNPCRVQVKFLEGGDKKSRVCQRCKESF